MMLSTLIFIYYMLSVVVKIVKLTVSAGDNKVIQYPENSVKLQAFALPAPTNGNVYICT